jgi:ubiquinol-cytochrome c reductase cytochrome b subunit
LILLIGTAFLGYVLPWGQMSLWGATVITNLLSTIPFIGPILVVWVWGGFRVTSYTLGVFYSLHFVLPLIIFCLVLFHLIVLHETGSSSKISLHTNENKIKFYFLFVIKDMINFVIIFVFLFCIFLAPLILGDPENFNLANPLSSPLHIQPEWYFLFAYAILRSIPNKLGGVLALAASVIFFYLFPFFSKIKKCLLKRNSLLV